MSEHHIDSHATDALRHAFQEGRMIVEARHPEGYSETAHLFPEVLLRLNAHGWYIAPAAQAKADGSTGEPPDIAVSGVDAAASPEESGTHERAGQRVSQEAPDAPDAPDAVSADRTSGREPDLLRELRAGTQGDAGRAVVATHADPARTADERAAREVLSHEAASQSAGATTEGPWQRLRVALVDHEAWYLPTRMSVSAWINEDSGGRFHGGVYVEGDPLTRDEWGETPLIENGDSPEQVIDGLIEAIAQYRADREREHAEMEAEQAALAQSSTDTTTEGLSSCPECAAPEGRHVPGCTHVFALEASQSSTDATDQESLARAMTEAGLQDAIIKAAKLYGWKVAHFRPAKTDKGWRTPIQGDAGFPDLVLARRGRVLMLELKRHGKYATPEQADWINAVNGPELVYSAKVQAYQIQPTQLDVVLRWLE